MNCRLISPYKCMYFNDQLFLTRCGQHEDLQQVSRCTVSILVFRMHTMFQGQCCLSFWVFTSNMPGWTLLLKLIQ